MSLFRLREWWTHRAAAGSPLDGVSPALPPFASAGAFCVVPVDNVEILAVGSVHGQLTLLLPRAASPDAPGNVVLSLGTGAPIVQLVALPQTGEDLAPQLGVLHPHSFVTFHIALDERGRASATARMRVRLLLPAFCAAVRPVGGELAVAVGSLRGGNVTVLAGEQCVSTQVLSDTLLPGPLLALSNGLLVSATSDMTLRAFDWSTLGDERPLPVWTHVAGELVHQLCAGRITRDAAPMVVALGESSLFALTENGALVAVLPLGDRPVACALFRKHASDQDNMLVLSADGVLRVLDGLRIVWSCELAPGPTPVGLAVAKCAALPAAIVTLGPDGRLAASVLGTDGSRLPDALGATASSSESVDGDPAALAVALHDANRQLAQLDSAHAQPVCEKTSLGLELQLGIDAVSSAGILASVSFQLSGSLAISRASAFLRPRCSGLICRPASFEFGGPVTLTDVAARDVELVWKQTGSSGKFIPSSLAVDLLVVVEMAPSATENPTERCVEASATIPLAALGTWKSAASTGHSKTPVVEMDVFLGAPVASLAECGIDVDDTAAASARFAFATDASATIDVTLSEHRDRLRLAAPLGSAGAALHVLDHPQLCGRAQLRSVLPVEPFLEVLEKTFQMSRAFQARQIQLLGWTQQLCLLERQLLRETRGRAKARPCLAPLLQERSVAIASASERLLRDAQRLAAQFEQTLLFARLLVRLACSRGTVDPVRAQFLDEMLSAPSLEAFFLPATLESALAVRLLIAERPGPGARVSVRPNGVVFSGDISALLPAVADDASAAPDAAQWVDCCIEPGLVEHFFGVFVFDAALSAGSLGLGQPLIPMLVVSFSALRKAAASFFQRLA